jgi:predicted transcriptional regulator
MPSKYRLTVNLSAEEHRLLTALSDAGRVSRAWLVRQAVMDFLDRHRTEQVQATFSRQGFGKIWLASEPAVCELRDELERVNSSSSFEK